jgi:hypothetical protein
LVAAGAVAEAAEEAAGAVEGAEGSADRTRARSVVSRRAARGGSREKGPVERSPT